MKNLEIGNNQEVHIVKYGSPRCMRSISVGRGHWRSITHEYIFFFQLPLLPELIVQFDDYHAIASAFIDLAIDKTAFTPEDLEAYKNAAAKPGALTAMINYYRNIFPGLLNQREWDVLQVPTLMIWGGK